MKILHLYSNLMNLYGEYGNVVVLKKHLEDQGLEVEVVEKNIENLFDFSDFDFIYCGSGLESNLKIALKDLLERKDSFKKAVDDGKFVLFTGNAIELLGKTLDGKEALGLFDYEVKSSDSRISGDVVLKNEIFGEIVGFINKCTIIQEGENKGIFQYVFKDENLANDKSGDGFTTENVFATHVIGPILAKNPKMMEYYVSKLCALNNIQYKDIEYMYEKDSYEVTLKALKERSSK